MCLFNFSGIRVVGSFGSGTRKEPQHNFCCIFECNTCHIHFTRYTSDAGYDPNWIMTADLMSSLLDVQINKFYSK